jgi:hypothetical protein
MSTVCANLPNFILKKENEGKDDTLVWEDPMLKIFKDFDSNGLHHKVGNSTPNLKGSCC